MPGRAVVIGCAYGDDAELVASYGFDVIIECTTSQSLPPELHDRAAHAVASLCVPGGEILVIARCPGEDDSPSPPWLLTESEVLSVATGDVRPTRVRRIAMRGGDRWVGEFERDYAPGRD